MPATRSYKRGFEFPHEGFVQRAIENYFTAAGFQLTTDNHIDLQCVHPVTSETWHIEAKGVTTQIGLDFRTCVGQLVQGMHSESAKYAIAIPDTQAYQAQVAKLKPWVVSRLGIHWLFVSQDGSVRIVAPSVA
ncbi:MAG: hypothetical protein E6K53_16765 [Gammaproteobacteria bacterium]|nr:MAG: hypothetical protein E6K53_16765 [Gammaproteobacteria bacterium]